MNVYLGILLALIIIGIPAEADGRPQSKRLFLLFAFTLLILVSGMRAYTVGADTPPYTQFYQEIAYRHFSHIRYEAGFTEYVRILRTVSGTSEPYVLLMVSSIITIGIYTLLTAKYSKDPLLSLLLYISLQEYFMQMNTMRQSIAMSITVCGFMFLMNNRSSYVKAGKILSPLLFALAAQFHSSAWICFIPYFLILYMDRKFRNVEEVSASSAFKNIIGVAIFLFLIYAVLQKGITLLLPAYSDYLDSTWADPNYFGSLLNSAIPLAFLECGKRVLKKQPLTRRQRNSVILAGLSFVFYVLSMRMEFWNRLAGYFNVYLYAIWIPEFTSAVKDNRDRWILKTGIFLMSLLVMIIILTFRPEWTKVVPYNTH